ncbi:hypothetical protein ACER0A_001450 [Haloimpatiens sp. FM7315]|uniref:hypothetical protein n=1 Tax=Haloimpatiens sp. FM7315 TaxID=3298609 RepID=UPI00370AA629
MLNEEIKRRLHTKYVLLSVIAVFILTMGLNVMIVSGQKDLPKIVKEESVYSGKITEDKLYLGLKKVRDEKSDEIKYQPLVGYIYGLVSSYPGVLYSENRIEDFKDEYAKNFYECWKKKFIKILERIPKQERNKALKEIHKVKTPFVRFEACYFWNYGIDNLKVIFLIIIFMVTFFAAATYSESIEDGSMEIIFATKLKKKLLLLRLIPVIMYGVILVLAALLGTGLVLGTTAGFNGLNSSFKVYALFSIGNFTLGGAMILMTISEILGIFALATMLAWISIKTSKTSLSTVIGIAINIFYLITIFAKIPGRIFKVITNLLPIASSQIINDLSGFSFYMGLWSPYRIIIGMIIVLIVFLTLLIREISKPWGRLS